MAIGTTIKIGMDSRAVQRGLKDIGKGFSNLNKIGGQMVTTFAKWGAGIGVAAIAGITALTAKLIQIGEVGRATDARLKNVVRQMGLFGDSSDSVSERLADLADTQSRLLGIDDDVISNTMSKLLTFRELAKTANVVGGAFDRASQAALDMAAMGFGEAEQNAVQLGKALEDPVAGLTALRRTGITFTNEQREVIASLVETGKRGEAMNVILEAIETQVGGTAAATAVASKKIKKALDQIVEEFAKKFIAGFDSLPGGVEKFFNVIKERANQFGGIFGRAISDSIQGNFDTFIAIGEFVGKKILNGTKNAFKIGAVTLWDDLGNWLKSTSWGQSSGLTAPNYAPSVIDQANREQETINALGSRIASGSTGLVPGYNGSMRYARPGESGGEDIYNYETKEWSKGIKVSNDILKKIEVNTQAGAKF